MRNIQTIVVLALIGLLVVGSISYYVAYFNSSEVVEVQVEKTDRIASGESSHYRVYTKNEVFVNRDSFWYMKFNSSDLQTDLQPGETYLVKVVGWRWPFFSWYRNIVEIKSRG